MALKAMLSPGTAEQYLTAALVLATAVSGWFAVETVSEMQESRLASLRPYLLPVVEFAPHTGNGVLWGVKNVGPGAALDVAVALAWTKLMPFELRRAGISAQDAMEFIGHESLDMLKRYNIATKDDLEKAIAKRGALDERESAG